MDSIEDSLRSLQEALAANTVLTQTISDNTSGMVSFVQELQAGARFLCRVSMGISWALKTIRENWPVIVLLLGGFAYLTKSQTLSDFVAHLIKL